jgi:hypothetical protein
MVDQVPNTVEQGAKKKVAKVKKPYRPPVLTNLGSLRDMTMTTTGGTNVDGGKKQHTGRGGLYVIVESDA